MSLIGKIATTVVGAVAGKVLGGREGTNGPRVDPVTGIDMANKLSAECGFPITQSQANYAKAAAGGDRALACEILRPAGMNQQPNLPFPGTPPIGPSPTVISGGAPAPVSVLKTPALPPSVPPVTPTAFGGPRMSLISTTGGMAAAGPIIRAGTQLIGNIFRTSTGRITGFMLGGRRISRKAAVKLAKDVGIATAAGYLGVQAADLAQAILDESTRRRRRRGITARDLANARRVACTVSKMARDLNVKPAVRRRTSCR